MNPRYSVLLCNQSITEYKYQIDNWLHQGVKVIWLGKDEDVRLLKAEYPAFAKAFLMLAGIREVIIMAVSYKKLWKLLIDKDMKKKELEQRANVSHYTVSKMYRGENVTIDILERICKALDCSIDDVMEFVPDKEERDEVNDM